MSQGQQPAEFMPTHPKHETRIKQFEEWMPEALAIREQRCRHSPPKTTLTPAQTSTPTPKDLVQSSKFTLIVSLAG
jgi:hypothetical protein